MENKPVLLIVGAVVFASLAGFTVQHHIDNTIAQKAKALADQYTPLEVVVPNRDLLAGERIDGSVLAKKPFPRIGLHRDAIEPGLVSQAIGRRVLGDVKAGDPLLFSHLSSTRGEGFSTLIEEGMRALTFPVDILSSVSGMLRPADRIDLLITLLDANEQKTFTLLDNVKILATGTRVDELNQRDPQGRFQTVTLLVSTENAARIHHARQAGSLTVALRGPEDESSGFEASMTNDKLLGRWRERAPVKRSVEIIRGNRS